MLDWDSAFFGFPVALLDARLRGAQLESALDATRARGARLAYWLPADDAGTRAAAGALGGAMLGTRVHYGRDVSGTRPAAAVARCRAPTRELVALAVAAGAQSRFALDPRLPAGSAARLYTVWLRKSFAGAMGDEVWTASDDAGTTGFVSLAFRGATGVIGLLAVAERSRGAGVGRALTEAAMARFAERGLARATVVTQGENAAACRLYEASGYRRSAVELVAHFWL